MTKPNETIARLDRDAKRLGVMSYRPTAGNEREFTLPSGRVLVFKPGGKGVLKVTAHEWDPSDEEWKIDSTATVSIERLRALLAGAAPK